MMHVEFHIRTCAKQLQIDDDDKSIPFISLTQATSFALLSFRHRPDMIFFCISYKQFLLISCLYFSVYFYVAVGDGKSKYDLHCQ